MDKARLDAIRDRLSKVTPGEWRVVGDGIIALGTDESKALVAVANTGYELANMAFIAAAPGMVRELVEEVERLTGLLDIAHSVLPREKADKLWLMWKHKGVAPDERKDGA